MMNYKINLGGWNGVFAVPFEVVDKYIKLASSSSLKILLYFLRHSGEYPDILKIAADLSLSPDDVADAMDFWRQVGLLTLAEGELVPASEISQPVNTQRTVQVKTEEKSVDEQIDYAKLKTAALRAPEFSPAEIAQTVTDDEIINFLFKTCEALYGRPLKHAEQNALITITEHIGLPAEVTLTLVDYCFSINKSSPAFLKEAAMDWAENGINNLAAAEEHISALQKRYSSENKVKAIFGINRALTQKEKEFISVWFNDWGFSAEIVEYAYELNVNSKGKFSFPYINKVLESWHDKGYTSKEQIAAKRRENARNNENNSSLDIKGIDESILDDYT